MWAVWLRLLVSEIPIKHFPGKSCKDCSFRSVSSDLALTLFLALAFCGLCEEILMVSVPLGFEISGSDRSQNFVSENGVFAFGFMEKNSDADDVFVVGTRYNLGSKAENFPVWTVGGGLRVSMNSAFRLEMDGRLVLLENSSGVIVWSSNTSNLGVQKASLLNNGNFILMNSGDQVVWQSFNSPTNTLLPGQSLQFPQTLRAPSRKSVSSYYNFVIRQSGELALVWEHNVTYWRSHFSSSAIVKEVRFDSNGVLGLYDDKDKSVWSVSSRDSGDPSINLRHLRIDQDGNLRIYSWDNVVHIWRAGWQAVEDQCNVFASCGLFSVCGYNSSGTVCNCLFSDSFHDSDPAIDLGSSGCRKMVDSGNCRMRTSMMKMDQTILYGLYPPHDEDIMLSEEACKEYCSNDTSCIAVTSKNDGSGICTVKRTSFISGHKTPSLSAVSFLKVCLVPQAVSARGANTETSLLLLGGLSAKGDSSKKLIGALAIIVLVTVSVIITMEIVLFLFVFRRRQLKASVRIPFGKDSEMHPHYSVLIRLSFEDIKELTGNFVSQLGPSIFKGTLPNRMPVIAKLLNNVVVSEKVFRMVVSTLGRMHHRNLVALKGFCFEPEHKVIIYEYVRNGSLEKWLFDSDQNEGNWQQRLSIALGIARALAYLHSECQQCINHGNLKLANVLLDEGFVPIVTDFGLQSLLQNEAVSTAESASERDIYMLGELLLQLVTCKRDVPGGNPQQIMDMLSQEQTFLAPDDLKGIERVVTISLWCMQHQPFLRPSIGEVVKVLEGSLSVDRPPSAFDSRHHENDQGGGVPTEIEVEC